MRHVRVPPFPIERVRRAVTTQDELNVYFLPIARVGLRLGGRAPFTWGQSERKLQVGEENSRGGKVAIVEPPWVIHFQGPEEEDSPPGEGYLHFKLETIRESTCFALIQRLRLSSARTRPN